MFRFYADENLSVRLVNKLKYFGYDIVTAYEFGQGNQRIPDEQVLSIATVEARAVLTFNRNDFRDLHYAGKHHAGILIGKDDRDVERQAQAIHQYLQTQSTLANRCLRVLKHNQPGFDFVVREYLRNSG
jgi:uncharacterized protein with PIN domain